MKPSAAHLLRSTACCTRAQPKRLKCDTFPTSAATPAKLRTMWKHAQLLPITSDYPTQQGCRIMSLYLGHMIRQIHWTQLLNIVSFNSETLKNGFYKKKFLDPTVPPNLRIKKNPLSKQELIRSPKLPLEKNPRNWCCVGGV